MHKSQDPRAVKRSQFANEGARNLKIKVDGADEAFKDWFIEIIHSIVYGDKSYDQFDKRLAPNSKSRYE